MAKTKRVEELKVTDSLPAEEKELVITEKYSNQLHVQKALFGKKSKWAVMEIDMMISENAAFISDQLLTHFQPANASYLAYSLINTHRDRSYERKYRTIGGHIGQIIHIIFDIDAYCESGELHLLGISSNSFYNEFPFINTKYQNRKGIQEYIKAVIANCIASGLERNHINSHINMEIPVVKENEMIDMTVYPGLTTPHEVKLRSFKLGKRAYEALSIKDNLVPGKEITLRPMTIRDISTPCDDLKLIAMQSYNNKLQKTDKLPRYVTNNFLNQLMNQKNSIEIIMTNDKPIGLIHYRLKGDNIHIDEITLIDPDADIVKNTVVTLIQRQIDSFNFNSIIYHEVFISDFRDTGSIRSTTLKVLQELEFYPIDGKYQFNVKIPKSLSGLMKADIAKKYFASNEDHQLVFKTETNNKVTLSEHKRDKGINTQNIDIDWE